MNFKGMEKLQCIIDERDAEINRLTALVEQENLNFKNKVQELNDYYESILAVIPGNVYWLDRNNVFLGCNNFQAKDAKLESRKDIVGKTNFDMPWKDQAEELNRLNNLVMETGMPHTAEEYAVTAHGLAIFFSQKTPLRNKDGAIIGVLGVSIDITERKKMEVALRRAKESAEVANLAKTEFIANMSHDIHLPLSGIVGLSYLLEEKLCNQEEKQYAHWIKDSGKQLLDLLNSVLGIVSDDHINETDLNEGLFDLRTSVSGIIQLVLPSAKLKKLDLSLELDDAAPQRLITDSAKLHRILLNLIGNAIKFTENGSINLKIDLAVDNKEYVQLKFSVQDTGIGIAKEFQTKVYDRFFRVNPSYKEEHGGLGVGLHIAQNYVGLLGGEIKLESKLGEGSTFYFTLPMKVANSEISQTAVETVSALPKIPSTSLPQILIVEPNIVALRFIETLVIQTGFNFSSATDARNALNLVKCSNFDLIMTDIDLPGMSGEDLARSIRDYEKASSKGSSTIIGLTTHSQTDSKELNKSCLNKIISKPINLSTMQKLVDEYINFKEIPG
ncbi:MAG: response regulator [Tatlockia sp.]|nr:response regulator [Tatlockia sp.]